MSYPYIVIDRTGYYGDQGRVHSAHRTEEAARRASRKHAYIDENRNRRYPTTVAMNDGCGYKKGDTFYRDMAPREVKLVERMKDSNG